MSAGRGFKVRVTREDAPEYCGRCHSDAAYIGKYKPGQRTDQVALYRKCVHGEQLAKGNNKTANCIDCHGIHNIRAADDPQSPVHPSRLAGKCGACHGEIAKMFQQSPHARVFTTSGMAVFRVPFEPRHGACRRRDVHRREAGLCAMPRGELRRR